MNTLIHHPARHVAGTIAVSDSPLPQTAGTFHPPPPASPPPGPYPQIMVPEKVSTCCTPLSVFITDCLNDRSWSVVTVLRRFWT